MRMTQAQPLAILLRPGTASDFSFATVVYFRAMGETLLRTVGPNPERQAALLLALWDLGDSYHYRSRPGDWLDPSRPR